MNLVDVIEDIGGGIGCDPKLMDIMSKANNKGVADLSGEERHSVKEQYLAVASYLELTGLDSQGS
jgi:hypothetical protein